VSRLAALVLTLAALAVAAGGCGGGDDSAAPAPPPVDTTKSPPPQGGDEEEGVRGGGGGIAGAEVGQPAPEIAGTTLDGDELALSDLRGKKVIVNLWSSW
jgi:hypothetical protein